MKILSPPEIICRELSAFESDLDSVRAAFQTSEVCALRQAWRPEPETHFEPAFVRAGWRGHSLLLFVELTAADISTRATDHNQPFWKLGDTFEIFLRPAEQTSYVELHLTPNNLRSQLRFAHAGDLERARQTGSFENALIRDYTFQSQTWVQPENNCWFAFLEIPANLVSEKPNQMAGTKWFFSFSRYEYARGQNEPVLSSTSPHAEADFHRQQDWGVLQFESSPDKGRNQNHFYGIKI